VFVVQAGSSPLLHRVFEIRLPFMRMYQARVLPLQTGSGLPDFQSLTNWSGIGFSEKSESFQKNLKTERVFYLIFTL